MYKAFCFRGWRLRRAAQKQQANKPIHVSLSLSPEAFPDVAAVAGKYTGGPTATLGAAWEFPLADCLGFWFLRDHPLTVEGGEICSIRMTGTNFKLCSLRLRDS